MEELFTGMVVWHEQICILEKNSVVHVKDRFGGAQIQRLESIDFLQWFVILISKYMIAPGPYNIPNHVYVLTGAKFPSMGLHGCKVCIEFLVQSALLSCLTLCFNINIW